MRTNPFTAPLATLALSLLLGCSGSTEPPGTVAGPPENRGVLVASFDDVSNLTWSTDASEVYFVEGYVRIRAVTATAGNARTLYTSNVSISHLSAAGNKLYASTATLGTPVQYRILRIDPANSNVETVLTYHGQVSRDVFAISADERFVAFGDSLYDLVSATQTALPRGQSWSFSPDGSLLLYEQEPVLGGPTSFIPIATNGAPSLPMGSASDIPDRVRFTVGAHHWIGNDPKLLRVDAPYNAKAVQVFDFDLRTATNRAIAWIATENPFSRAAAISADGKRAVVWIGIPDGDQLHAIDTQTSGEKVIATVHGDTYALVQSVVLSANGSNAAYVLSEFGSFTGPAYGAFTKVYVVMPKVGGGCCSF